MKKVTIISCLLVWVTISFSQQADPPQPVVQKDLLKKSKNQKKAAWILLGAGGAFIITDLIIPRGESKGFTGSYYGIPNIVEEYKNDGIKRAFGVTGVVSVLVSIPLFLASGKNKRKAMKMSFKFQKAPQIQNTVKANRTIPSLNLKIYI